LPLRKKAMTPWQHMWMLRLAVAGVAAFAIFFSTVFPQTQYITLWWFLTGTVFTGGAGAAIIGGLYWKKGTTAAAWAGAITGSALALIGIVCGSFWPWVVSVVGPTFAAIGIELPAKFWFNNQVSATIAMVIAMTTYIITSLLTCRRDFNLDKMLHRGQYAVEADGGKSLATRRFDWHNVLHFDHNFTWRDKLVAGGIFWWSMLLVAVNLVVTVWNLAFYRWPIEWWAHYWMITGIIVPCVIAVATLVWFSIGGFWDMRDFFRDLRTMRRDSTDDGRVQGGHQEAGDPATSPADQPAGAPGMVTSATPLESAR
jgi:SSS family solute:Na+ symporter